MKEKILHGIIVKIHSNYPSLLPAEKRVADFLLKKIDDIEVFSINELSQATNTSKSTITRFCKSIGYEGFKQFKISAIKDHVVGVNYSHEDITEDDDSENIVRKICKSNSAICVNTGLLNDTSKLEEVAKLILNSHRVFLFGDGAIAPILTDFYQKMLRIGILCIYSGDRRFQSMQAALTTNSDVALAFDFSGSSKHTIYSLRTSRNNSCKTISICNVIGSPLTREAEINLFAPGKINVQSTGTFGPRIGLLCIVDCLFALIMKFSNNQFSEYMELTRKEIVKDWIKK